MGWVDTEGGRAVEGGWAASDDRRGEGHDGISIPKNYRKRNCLDFFMERKDVRGTRRGIQNTKLIGPATDPRLPDWL